MTTVSGGGHSYPPYFIDQKTEHREASSWPRIHSQEANLNLEVHFLKCLILKCSSGSKMGVEQVSEQPC